MEFPCPKWVCETQTVPHIKFPDKEITYPYCLIEIRKDNIPVGYYGFYSLSQQQAKFWIWYRMNELIRCQQASEKIEDYEIYVICNEGKVLII